jgi:hypothetical protein
VRRIVSSDRIPADLFDSTRKWKEKLKEWKFEKHISMGDMKIIVAKQQKRHKEGKETVFIHCSNEILSERIETFKRRKIANESEPISPSAGRYQ